MQEVSTIDKVGDAFYKPPMLELYNRTNQHIPSASSRPNGVSPDGQLDQADKTGVLAYFSKATGLNKSSREAETRHSSFDPSTYNRSDGIHMSLDGHKELSSQNENPSEAFKDNNPLNMSAFMNNLGIDPEKGQSEQAEKKVSLADKLRMISMKTSGEAW